MKLIALDLDGTLLNSGKVVSERNAAALSLAAAQGNVIAPATGRALRAIPEQVMAFPFVHYAITINGAKVSDTRTGQAVLRAEIALDTCLRLLDFVGRYDAMYDCYWNDTGWVDRSFLERGRYYNSDEEVVTLLRTTRAPVDDLKAFLRENGQPVQKVQLCFRDMAERETARAEIAAAFPEIDRRLRPSEARSALAYLENLGLTGFCQETASADAEFIPPFDLTGVDPI